jgi:hypothetical protein
MAVCKQDDANFAARMASSEPGEEALSYSNTGGKPQDLAVLAGTRRIQVAFF